MKKSFWCGLVSFLLLSLALNLSAVEHPYQAGKIINIQQDVHTRVLYYVVNTPVTQDDPYYDVTIQVKDMVYVGEYTPRHSADTLPLGWDVHADVELRVEKGAMFARRPDGRELQLAMVKHYSAAPQSQPGSSSPSEKPVKKLDFSLQ